MIFAVFAFRKKQVYRQRVLKKTTAGHGRKRVGTKTQSGTTQPYHRGHVPISHGNYGHFKGGKAVLLEMCSPHLFFLPAYYLLLTFPGSLF